MHTAHYCVWQRHSLSVCCSTRTGQHTASGWCCSAQHSPAHSLRPVLQRTAQSSIQTTMYHLNYVELFHSGVSLFLAMSVHGGVTRQRTEVTRDRCARRSYETVRRTEVIRDSARRARDSCVSRASKHMCAMTASCTVISSHFAAWDNHDALMLHDNPHQLTDTVFFQVW